MRISVKNGQVILVDGAGESPAISACLRALDGHALAVQVRSDNCIVLQDLGVREEACREPINITRTADTRYVAISNLHPTPFVLDNEAYGSIEGFWQSLKIECPVNRRQVAALSGIEAKNAGRKVPQSALFEYQGEQVRTGTHQHWSLMERACAAKFAQNEEARRALLATGKRPLTHIVRGDSRTIPGVIMAEIWMRIRKQIAVYVSSV